MKLILNKQVSINPINIDRYGRTIATVDIDSIDLSEHLIKNGYAWLYYSNDKDLKKLEITAKANKLNLWSRPAVPPWEFRKNKR